MTSGVADVFVTTFNATTDDFLQKLPKSKKNAQWLVTDVNSLNQGSEDKAILIM